MLTLTEEGEKKVREFLERCKEKQSMNAGNGRPFPEVPTRDRILKDIEESAGFYHYRWGKDDKTYAELTLRLGKDFTWEREELGSAVFVVTPHNYFWLANGTSARIPSYAINALCREVREEHREEWWDYERADLSAPVVVRFFEDGPEDRRMVMYEISDMEHEWKKLPILQKGDTLYPLGGGEPSSIEGVVIMRDEYNGLDIGYATDKKNIILNRECGTWFFPSMEEAVAEAEYLKG